MRIVCGSVMGVVMGLSLLAACDRPADVTDTPDADAGMFAHIDDVSPYAGQWAAERNHCANDRMVWTIEERRMAIVPAMRFCAFEDIFISRAPDTGEATWSAEARCLAEGEESRAFVFFRVKQNLHEMRVTFNDSASVNLVRCPMQS